MSELAAAFAEPFMQRALLAGLLVSLAGAWLGVFVVQRRLAFLGHGLAHSAFGGVALGLLLGLDPQLTALPFTLAVALLITWVAQTGRLGQDTAIGVLFALSLAGGIVLLALRPGYSADAFTFLFGSILSVEAGDVLAAAALGALVLAASPLWGRLAFASFDRESARADGLPVARDDYLLAALIAAAVAVSVKIVGALLVSAFLVIPAAAARLLARSLRAMTLLALALSAASVLLGLLASWLLDLPSGAVIVLVQAAAFGVALAAGRRG